MSPEQMAKEAIAAIADKTRMSMVLPRPWKNKPPGFPRGELLCENHNGTNVWSFDPLRVITWLAANELIEVKLGVAKDVPKT